VAEANDLYLAGRYRDAVARLQDAIKQDAGYADAWALLGKSNARLATNSDIESSSARSELASQALSASLQAAEIAPMLYEAQVALALGYRAMGESERSRQATQRAIAINPRLAEAYEILANSYGAGPNCRRGIDEERAESLYRKALELDPQLVTAHVARAINRFWGKPGAQAGLDYLASVGDLVPAVRLLWPRAVALLFLKRPDEAEQHLREQATLGPPSIQDEWVMAGVELLRRNDDAARRRMEAVIEKDSATFASSIPDASMA
jgi:tetratricopeptide (TPR) repeat protein